MLTAWLLLGMVSPSFAYKVTHPIPGVESHCYEEQQPLPWSYCIDVTTESRSQDVLYHLHGRNGDATWWNDSTYFTGRLQRRWLEEGKAIPTVISVSFGKLWFLTEDLQNPEKGLYSVFMKQVMATVEARLGRPVGSRYLVGESMGGVNALMLAFKSGTVFSRIAALCPPLPLISPFASLARKIKYMRDNHVQTDRAVMMILLGRKIYPTRASWLLNEPVHASERLDGHQSAELYLSCGNKDEWGCMPGSEKIVEQVRNRGGSMDWHPLEGGHCVVDVPSLADFLLR